MSNPYLYPKLRYPLDIRIEQAEREQVLYINCPLGVTKAPLLLVSAVAPIVACFEGQLAIPEIVEKFKPYGVERELVEKLVQLLDEHLFLATPRFFGAEKATREEFLSSRVRPAALAGSGYSADPSTLTKQLEKFLELGREAEKLKVMSERLMERGEMIGLMAPHIDYMRGGTCYGITYHQLRNKNHDLYILIGTSHQYSPHMFHLSAKDFATPLGVLPCDTEFIACLAQRYGCDRSFADEILHRREHSLELQLPFLQRTGSNAKIVPILVGSFYPILQANRSPSEVDQYESFAASLATCLQERTMAGQKACIVAGVDMAHVGRHFGDSGQLSPEFMQHIEMRDKIYLEAIRKHDKKELFSHIAEDGDQRRICGFPTMYTVLDTLERIRLQYQTYLFDYRQAVDYTSDCAVTFAGMGLFRSI